MNIPFEVGIGLFSTMFGTLLGSAVTAYAANAGLRARIDRVETRVGITDTGALTGNGLIGETRSLWEAIEHQQHH